MLLSSVALRAQYKHVPLSDDDTDKLREVADQPPERVKLYVKFIDERIAGIKAAVELNRGVPADQPEQLEKLMDEFTSLNDELEDNLDGYADHHDDVRKALKQVLEADGRWQQTLKLPPPNPVYDFKRTMALDAAASSADQAQKMLEEQNVYFKDKKKKDAGGG